MISKKVVENLEKSSWVRAMFDKGTKLRQIHGDDKVFDFSLGNPDPEPPASVKETLKNIISEDPKGIHHYMSNAGFLDVREKISKKINSETGLSLTVDNIIMTCGAAGGLNVVFKTLLDPGDEVIIFAPFFGEYNFYIDNHGGIPVIIPPVKDSFEPDLELFESKINKKTKALIINSPNNPSGYIYSEETLNKISDIISSKEKEFNTTIYVVSDEPYNQLIYDDIELPSILKIFKNSFVVNSFSKSLSLPGERIGYIAVNPDIENIKTVIDSLIFSNRILGFVNAPALFQKVISYSLDAKVDVEIYKARRDRLYEIITECGFSCIKPQGAFYLFPKSPIENDVEFVEHALKYNLLLVPGTGFGCPGYFRMAYCVSIETIENSYPAFKALAKDFNLI
ncbi:pyridoxal phosphate-dependent aminotransferase [Acetivibrio saccincola]|jgi:aspartate aminotransferase|uniref:Aminotransferase n=1 Tax=Acetivibrio saccincola TaxID=1677857 RepID=A0A2K9E1U2_9FIRM|nr:pyridoxal phosphate-dependent aminotransferase [Acetivibrio saccincola]AUG57359.1 Aspartate aminotransferase [Acetivibrio saccincola]NLW27903.1 pyridoxal phosphate-dependent aminotransferase [Acetivibrio saccincola]PQQ67288.1 aspartate aminotransferase [Acetivibrio saccincola]HOA96892.1 pyridoxal phosphate-dependent aminotransferase [Acetivibrio saccincola]HQD28588.1 pyridoxal phosphate-dependent aminotransferase [Acetivibrio saccincola]